MRLSEPTRAAMMPEPGADGPRWPTLTTEAERELRQLQAEAELAKATICRLLNENKQLRFQVGRLVQQRNAIHGTVDDIDTWILHVLVPQLVDALGAPDEHVNDLTAVFIERAKEVIGA